MYLTIRVIASDSGMFYREKIRVEKEYNTGEIDDTDLANEEIIALLSTVGKIRVTSAINEYLSELEKSKEEDEQKSEDE